MNELKTYLQGDQKVKFEKNKIISQTVINMSE